MASKMRYVPSKSLKFSMFWLKFFGLWYYDGKFKTIHFIYGQIMYALISYIYAGCMLMNVIKVWGDLPEMADGMCLMVTIMCIIFKLGFLNKKKLKTLVEMLDSEELNKVREDQDFIIKKSMSITHRNSIGICALCTFISWCWNMIPVVTGAFTMKKLPIKAWFPFPTNVSPFYEAAYLYLFLGVWIGALINCSIDGLVAGLMNLTCGQLKVLKHSLRNLRSHALEQLNRLTEEEICPKCYNRPSQRTCVEVIHLTRGDYNLEEEVYRELIKCIKHHQAIIEFVEAIQTTFSNSVFSQFSASTVVICMTAFELSVITPFSMLFYTIFFYMVNMIFQLFCYCWYGNELFLTSLTINEDVYYSDWYRFGPRITKIMFIMMERGKIPMNITAGKLFNLSLETFTSILRSAYSFYAVLNQMGVDINLDIVENTS